MNRGDSEDASVLYAAYQEEADCYSRALALAEALPAVLGAGENAEDRLQPILGLLEEVAAIETRIADTKRRWQDAGCRPSPELGRMLGQVAELIARLAERVQGAEQEAAARKERLVPQVDNLIRGQQMQQAYGVAMGMRGPECGRHAHPREQRG